MLQLVQYMSIRIILSYTMTEEQEICERDGGTWVDKGDGTGTCEPSQSDVSAEKSSDESAEEKEAM
jgi:hypothetical protein